LARALAEKHGRRLTKVEDWRPLLRFTDGNPLTGTGLVGQALRDRLKTKAQIEAFVARLRAGESAFQDEASEGRSKSLGASLKYGFKHAFSEAERTQLALLHFFQGFVEIDALLLMGHPAAALCVPAVRDLTREAGMTLLDRAAEVGLLTAHGDGYYTIHPALPWFFKDLFDASYPLEPEPQSPLPSPQPSAAHAFVEATRILGEHRHRQYQEGNPSVITILTAEEANLLHARQLARAHGWWGALIGTMRGLYALYSHTGRRVEWAGLLNEIVPEFVDPATDGPLPGQEDRWGSVNLWRVRLARDARDWAQAERLQRTDVEWARQRMGALLTERPETWDHTLRNDIRSLATSLHELGQIRRQTGNAECVTAYKEALNLAQRVGARAVAATCAFNLQCVSRPSRPARLGAGRTVLPTKPGTW
jgi:hypothetical protein